MNKSARHALESHRALLEDSFLCAFPSETLFPSALSQFCASLSEGKMQEETNGGVFMPLVLELGNIAVETGALSGIPEGAILLECAIFERILSVALPVKKIAPDFSNSILEKSKIERESDSFSKNLVSLSSFLRALRSLKLEKADSRSFGNGFGDVACGDFLPSHGSAIERYARIFRTDKKLLALSEKIGKHEENPSAHSRPVKNSRPAVSRDGVWFSDSIPNVLSSELALKSNPKTRLEFLRRFSERQLLCWKPAPDRAASGGKKRGRGAAIVLLDTSGSMHGINESVSKAAALSVISSCVSENRRVLIISFSVEREILEVSKSDPKTLCKIGEFVSQSFHGGTDISGALDSAIGAMTKNRLLENADILLVSDFNAPPVQEKTEQLVKKAKENGTKLYALLLGNGDCSILRYCDEIVRYGKERFL